MVKKKFDKKNATTYSLVYQPTGSEVAGGLPGASDEQAPGEGDGAGAGAGGRMLHEFASHARSQQTLSEAELRKFRAKQGTPLDWLMEERGLKAENTLDERRRHELIELGFDDDGYDYLQHLKTLDDVRDGGREGDQGGEGDQGDESEQGDEGDQGDERSKKLIISQKKIIFDTPNAHLEREREKELAKAAKAIEAASEGGGSAGVFVKSGREFVASDDVAFFDAEQLTVMQQVSTEDDVTGMMGGVTAFARRRQDAGAVRAKRAYEISELERMMEEAERNGEEVEVGRVLGDGDLLDDFILAATQMDRGDDDDDDDDGDDDEAEGEREGDGEGDGDLSEGESWFSDSGSIAGRSVLTQTTDEVEGNASIRDPNSASKKKVPGPGSIASTYWREERQDRKKLLSVIDEQFEQLALEYDEDELGEMDELADDGYIQGGADVEDFESVLDEFIRDHPRREELGGPGAGLRGKLFLAEDMERHGFGNDHAALSIQMAKEAIRKMEAAAAEHEDGEDGEDGEGAAPANAHVEIDRRKFEREDAKWDCESILSLRSNLYNHPGTITEPSSKPPKTIKLGKNGLPVGYGPNGYVSTKTAGLGKIGDDDGSEGDSNDDGDDDDDDMVWSKPSTGPNVRKKGETAEEKKARKAAVKAAKRESRATKKEMKVMFAQERTKASMRESRNPSGLTEIKM